MKNNDLRVNKEIIVDLNNAMKVPKTVHNYFII